MEMLQAGKGAVSTQECSRSLTRPAPTVDSSSVFKLPSVSSLVSSTRTQSGRGVLTLHRCPQGVCVLHVVLRRLHFAGDRELFSCFHGNQSGRGAQKCGHQLVPFALLDVG